MNLEIFKNKKILITGHTGFKGSWLTQILITAGAKVCGYALEPNTQPSLFNILELRSQINNLIGDVRDIATLKNFIYQEKPEIIFHLAAQPLVRESYERPLETFQTNILGTANLMEAARDSHLLKAIVVITTDKVYENMEWVWPYRENDILGGHDPYSASKAAAEMIISSYRDSFFPVKEYGKKHQVLIASARAGNVLGGGDWAKDRLICDMVRAIFERKEPLTIRNPEAIRPWQFVLEPLAGYLLLANHLFRGNIDVAQAFNFSPEPDNFITVEELVKKTITVAQTGSYLHQASKDNKPESKLLKLDSTKAKELLKWKPQLDMDKTLEWTFEWYKEYYQGGDVVKVTRQQIDKYFNVAREEELKKDLINNQESTLLQIESLIKQHYKENKKELPTDKVPVSGKVYDEKELLNLVSASLEGWWTEQVWSEKFSNQLREFLPIKHVLLTNSGSSANLLAITALSSPELKERAIKQGDEVITTACGFPTTINPIWQIGARPVFIDVTLPTYNANIKQLKEAISPKTKAVFLAHTLGNPFFLSEVVEICKQRGIWLIEDNCDALGSTFDERHTGTWGDLATLSFYPAHHITCAEGGAVLTNNDLLAKIVRSLRDWGRDCWCATGKDNSCQNRFNQQHGDLPFGYDHKYIYSRIGYNLKITDLQAAIGVAQMEKLEDFIAKRRFNFNLLKKEFISAKLDDYFLIPEESANSRASWFGFPVTIKNNDIERSALLKRLAEHGVATRLLFAGNVTRQPYVKEHSLPYRQIGDLEISNRITEKTFWLGIYPALEERHFNYMIEILQKCLQKEA